MAKKYTMDEFEKMYLEAQKVVMEKLNQDLENADKENKMDAIGSMMYNLHNMMVMAEMHGELFKKED